MQIAGTIEILSDLDRCVQFGCQLRISVEIVVNDRLFDPREPFVIDHVTALQGFSEV